MNQRMLFVPWLYLWGALLFITSCSQLGNDTAGGGSEDVNTISGIIQTETGSPAARVAVHLRSWDHTSDSGLALAKLGAEPELIAVDTADEDGFFKFENVTAGSYLVEAAIDTSSAVRVPVTKQELFPVDLRVLRMLSTGTVTGSVSLPLNGLGNALVQLMGTDRYVQLDSGESIFEFRNIASGLHVVRASGLSPMRDAVDRTFEVASGETITDIVLNLGPAIDNSDGRLTGTILLPAGDTGSYAAEIDGYSLPIQPDSTGSFTIDIAPGVYTLRAWGTAPPRDTVSLSVEILPGTETSDVVLTLGIPLPGSISGRVVLPAGTSGQAVVEVVGADLTALTDASGSYSISGVEPGMHVVQAWGINPFRDTVSLDSVVVISGEETRGVDLNLPIMALIVDGINNHDWVRTTALTVEMLENSGLFSVAVSTTPPSGASQSEWDAWRPVFSDYDVVFINYNSGDGGNTTRNPWPLEVRNAFEVYMQNGGGLVVSQGAQMAFEDWQEYNLMIGLGWRTGPEGFHVSINDSGEVDLSPAGTVPYSFSTEAASIYTYTSSHPITEGLPPVWLHPPESIDFGLRGPAENMTVLSYAQNPDAGLNEPVAWTVTYGQGRVYNTALGDIVEDKDDVSMRCVGFQTLFIRGFEWAATGQVTYAVPNDFPTETEVTVRD